MTKQPAKPPIIIKLPVHGISVTMTAARDPKDPQYPEASSITSDLHGEDVNNDRYEAAITAIEAMILVHAEAGIDIAAKDYLYGIETAVDKVFDLFGKPAIAQDVCNECGEAIPPVEGGALENKHHLQSCSLYNADKE